VRVALLTIVLSAPALAGWQERYRAGELLLSQGRPDEAQRALIIALREAEAVAVEDSSLVVILDALGRTEFKAGRYRRAKTYFERSLGLVRGKGTAEEAIALTNAGTALQALGENTRAEEMFRRALQVQPRNAAIWHLLGQSLFEERRYMEAETALRQSLTIQEESADRVSGAILSDLASIYSAQRQHRQALDILDRAITATPPGQVRARMLANRAILRWKLGHRADAESDLTQALAEMEAAVSPLHPDVAVILHSYAAVLEITGRGRQAKEIQKRAQAIDSSFIALTNSRWLTVDWRDLK